MEDTLQQEDFEPRGVLERWKAQAPKDPGVNANPVTGCVCAFLLFLSKMAGGVRSEGEGLSAALRLGYVPQQHCYYTVLILLLPTSSTALRGLALPGT